MAVFGGGLGQGGQGRLANVFGAVEVHIEDGVPLSVFHLFECDISQDARVVNDGVQAAPFGHGCSHHSVGACSVGHRVKVGDGVATVGLNFSDNLGGCCVVIAFSVP